MIASLALTALTAAAPGLQQVTPLDDLSEVPEVLIAIEATGIRARSFCAEPLLLMLATPDRRVTVLHCLAPGSSTEGSFPRGALDDAWIEVFLPSEAGWISTGALCLGAAPRTGAWLWVRPGGRLAARAPGYGELDLSGQTRGTLLPLRIQPFVTRSEGASESQSHALPTHVPIPDPGGKPPSDTPPEIEEEPLPPF